IKHEPFDTRESEVSIRGNVGYLSNYDSFLGKLYVTGDILSCDRVKDATLPGAREVFTIADMREAGYDGEDKDDPIAFFHGPLIWENPDSPYEDPTIFYGPILAAENRFVRRIITDGSFTEVVEDARTANLAKNFGYETGKAVFDGQYFTMTSQEINNTEVHGSFAPVEGNLVMANVSSAGGYRTVGGDEDTADFARVFPCVKETAKNGAADTRIKGSMAANAPYTALDISLTTFSEGDPTDPSDPDNIWIHEVEPTEPISLMVDDLDLSGYTRPVLYHLLDDGTIAIVNTLSPSADSFSVRVTSFSTYFVAEKGAVSGAVNQPSEHSDNPKPSPSPGPHLKPGEELYTGDYRPVKPETVRVVPEKPATITIDGVAVDVTPVVTYTNAIDFTGKKITPEELGFKVDTSKVTSIVTIKAGSTVKPEDLIKVTYVGKKTSSPGKHYLYPKLKITKAAKKALSKSEYKKLKKAVKAANKVLKANKCYYSINKRSVHNAKITVKVKFTKSGKIKIKKGKLSGLKKVKIEIDGKKYTLTTKDYKITDPDPETGTVRFTGKKKLTGTIIIEVS
ncbi:MAG: hypothetical protein K6A71_06125, partial [Lachnospiraceae bacterium]|nr:hypothetical protein [Lachnospiraceae bacterium]